MRLNLPALFFRPLYQIVRNRVSVLMCNSPFFRLTQQNNRWNECVYWGCILPRRSFILLWKRLPTVSTSVLLQIFKSNWPKKNLEQQIDTALKSDWNLKHKRGFQFWPLKLQITKSEFGFCHFNTAFVVGEVEGGYRSYEIPGHNTKCFYNSRHQPQ